MIEPPPSLQTLVIAYGDYPSIPEAAWARFNHAMDDWKTRSRAGELKPVELEQQATERVAALVVGDNAAVTIEASEAPAFISWVVKEFAEALREAEIAASGGAK